MINFQKVDGFQTINWKKHNNAIIFAGNVERNSHMSFRNLPNVRFENMDQMNPITIANTRYIVISNPELVSEYLTNKA
jgi:ribosomal protein L4